MRRTIGFIFIFSVFMGTWCPMLSHAANSVKSVSNINKLSTLIDTDDIAACADDPAPSMNGRIPGLAGKPINLLAGAETTSRTDLTIGNLYPIAVKRTYNSRAGYDSPLGFGWGINYDRRLYTYPDGSVTLRKECGWKRRFTWSVSGYITPLGESGTLVQNADNSYTFIDKSGDSDVYDPQGRLIQLIDAKGASITITYTAQVRDGLMGLLLYNVGTTPLIVAYDYKISKIEEKNASGNPTGAQVTFAYDLNGRLTSITDSRRTVTYGHDNIGNLTSVTGPDTNITYGYTDANNIHRMTSVDEGKGAYVNTFDTYGRVHIQTHGTGEIVFDYITPYKKTKVTTTIKNSSGTVLNTNSRTVDFGENGQVVKETDTLGNVATYTRNSQTKITRDEYWENTGSISVPVLVLRSANDYTYDTYGNLKTKTEASKAGPSDWDAIRKTTTYIYRYEIDPQAPAATFHKLAQEIVKSVVDPGQNKIVTNTYDNATGDLLTTTDAGLLGNGTAYSYTTTYGYTNGKLTSIDGPRTDVTDVTSYVYDPTTGYLTSTTQPLIGTTTYSDHDALGNPRTVTDPNGNSTTYTYDDNGRVLTVTAAGDNNPTQYVYVAGGCTSCGGANKIDHITLPEGNTITYGYDANSNITSISDSLGNSINYTYDSEGNRLTEEIRDAGNCLQKSLSYSYDALNRLKRTTNPDASYAEYSYDSRGNRLSLRTPNSTLTTYSYDALNRLVATIQPGTITTGYGYNSNNNLTTVTDTNDNVTTHVYDDKGRVYQTISPDTGTTTYSYDPAGNMISKMDAKGITISYQYDVLNRLTKIDFPTDTDIVYVYDTCVNGKGRLCSMTDASGATVYEYTAKGYVKKETKTIDSVQYVTQYTYDQNGNLKTMTYPSGRVITYNYSNDRAVSVLNNAANLATNINYKPFGGMSALTYGNGLAESISYDNQYRVTGITAGAVINLSYPTYDANGNIKAITDVLDATKNKSFTYDALDRLYTANSTGIWGSLGWTYDGAGNRQAESGNTYTYFTNSNKLSNANGISYGYDNNGNTTTEGARQYIYNQNQRLIQVNNGATTAYYTYNGNGQRVKKNVNGTSTIFHYSSNGQIIAESDSTGNVTAEYIYLNSQPLAKIEGTNTYYYHNDHLGSPQKMTDGSGTVVWSADYKPFGEATVTVSTITNNLRGIGQYFDAETGLLYNYFRDLNPATGKYIESDPLLQRFFFKRRNFFLIPVLAKTPERLQPYSFVASNPMNLIDPLGLSHCVGGATCDFTPDMDAAIRCFDNCTGRDSAITSGRRTGQQNQHGQGTACDFGRNSNPDVSRDDAERCRAQCFSEGYGQEEQNCGSDGTHYHLQLHTVPGGQPGFRPGIAPCQRTP